MIEFPAYNGNIISISDINLNSFFYEHICLQSVCYRHNTKMPAKFTVDFYTGIVAMATRSIVMLYLIHYVRCVMI